MNDKPMLFASLLLDRPGSRTARQLGKVLVSSLLRSLFNGEIVIWRNFPEPLYIVERKGLHELDFLPNCSLRDEDDLTEIAKKYRLEMAISLIRHTSRYSWIILADEDVIALRNWDHLFANIEEDILVSRRADRELDPGFFAVRAEVYGRFLEKWQSFEEDSAPGTPKNFLGEVIEAAGLTMKEFERGEVVRPMQDDTTFLEVMDSAVVHLEGGKPEEKTKMAFALHMMRTFGDKDGLFLDLMES